MIHPYRLHSFAPRLNWLRWSCAQCGRTVDQDRVTGALVVVVAGADAPHTGGSAGRWSIWDAPTGDVRVEGPWEKALEGLEF